MLAPTNTFVISADQSVQAIIDSAPDNSRIVLKAGIYREHLIISNKRIQLVAETPPSFTATNTNTAPSFSVVFDGNGAKPAWNRGQSMIQIENSRRVEQKDSGDSFSTLISGIEIRNNGDINSQGQSAGITVNASDVIIKGNYLHDLQAHDGAAISVQNNSRVTAVNNFIWNNQAKRFGAIFDSKSEVGSIYSSNNLKGNKSAEGSAFYQDFGTGFFLSNLVQDGLSQQSASPVDSLPSGESKGAVMLRKGSTQSIILNKFVNNKVISSGKPHSGAINIETEGTTNNILLNTFIGNSVERSNNVAANGETGSGGAIGVFNNSTPIIHYNLFQGNRAGYGGSAIASSEFSAPRIISNLFIENATQFDVGDKGVRTGAGTLFFENTNRSEKPVVISNYFEANSAGQAPDIYIGDRSSADLKFNTFSDSLAGPYNTVNNVVNGSIIVNNGPSYHVRMSANTFVPNPPSSLPSGVVNSLISAYYSGGIQLDKNASSSYALPGAQLFSNTPYSVNVNSGQVFVLTPAIAVDYRQSNQGVLSDVNGYDRPSNTLTGAYETSRQSTTQEMNVPVWRFRKGYGALAHFYTANSQEKDDLINVSQIQQNQGKHVDWIFEGQTTNFKVSSDPLINYQPGGIQQILSPVYRFFNPLAGTHLYTINSDERDSVLTDLPHFKFEGIAYYALNSGGTPPAGGATLHRFFNVQSRSHFYTADTSEFQNVFANQSSLGFKYDGQAFIPGM